MNQTYKIIFQTLVFLSDCLHRHARAAQRHVDGRRVVKVIGKINRLLVSDFIFDAASRIQNGTGFFGRIRDNDEFRGAFVH